MNNIHGDLNSSLHIRFWGDGAVPEPLGQWEAVLREYAEVHHLNWAGQGGDATGGDFGWWYGERANLSLLVGAVWRSGLGTAMEEYKTTKGVGSGKYEGRADAYIMLGSGYFSVEAKHHFFSLHSGREESTIAGCLGLAVDDQTRNNDAADFSTSIAFSTPHSPVSRAATRAVRIKRHRGDEYPSVASLCPLGFRVDLFPDWADPVHTTQNNQVHPGLTVHIGFESQKN